MCAVIYYKSIGNTKRLERTLPCCPWEHLLPTSWTQQESNGYPTLEEAKRREVPTWTDMARWYSVVIIYCYGVISNINLLSWYYCNIIHCYAMIAALFIVIMSLITQIYVYDVISNITYCCRVISSMGSWNLVATISEIFADMVFLYAMTRSPFLSIFQSSTQYSFQTRSYDWRTWQVLFQRLFCLAGIRSRLQFSNAFLIVLTLVEYLTTQSAEWYYLSTPKSLVSFVDRKQAVGFRHQVTIKYIKNSGSSFDLSHMYRQSVTQISGRCW